MLVVLCTLAAGLFSFLLGFGRMAWSGPSSGWYFAICLSMLVASVIGVVLGAIADRRRGVKALRTALFMVCLTAIGVTGFVMTLRDPSMPRSLTLDGIGWLVLGFAGCTGFVLFGTCYAQKVEPGVAAW